MKKYLLTISTISVISYLLSPLSPSFAQGIKDSGVNLKSVAQKAGTTEDNISNITGSVINAVLSLVGLIFLALMVYAGMLWMTARGEEPKVEKAKEIIYASVIGMFITISAYALTAFVTSKFSK